MKKCVAGLLLGIAFCIGGCSSKPEATAPQISQAAAKNPNLIDVVQDDADMKDAIEKARVTLPQFLATLRAPQKGRSRFFVKKRFVYGSAGQAEHIWLARPTYNGRVLRATLDHKPTSVTSIKRGDTVTIAPDEISDWMYVEDDKLVGGTTTRVLLKRVSPEKRRQFLSKQKFRID